VFDLSVGLRCGVGGAGDGTSESGLGNALYELLQKRQEDVDNRIIRTSVTAMILVTGMGKGAVERA
jgi:hypothetical protein